MSRPRVQWQIFWDTSEILWFRSATTLRSCISMI